MGVRENPFIAGGSDVFAAHDDLQSIWVEAQGAAKALRGQDIIMPATDPQNLGYALPQIRKFFEQFGTIGEAETPDTGLSVELQNLLKEAQALTFSQDKGELFTAEQRTAVLTEFVEGVKGVLGEDFADPNKLLYAHLSDPFDEQVYYTAKQTVKGMAGQIPTGSALDPTRPTDFGAFIDEISGFFEGYAFRNLGEEFEPPPEIPQFGKSFEGAAEKLAAALGVTEPLDTGELSQAKAEVDAEAERQQKLLSEEQRSREFARKRFGLTSTRQPYMGFDEPSYRSTDPQISLEEYQRLEAGDAPIFYRRMTGSDDISKELGMFAGRDDNMRGFMDGVYEAVLKDVFGIKQGMRELRRTESDAVMAYLDEWIPDLLGGFMTVGDEVSGHDSSRGFRTNYRHGMFAFPTLDALADYTYGSGDILAMRGNLAGSFFQGNMFIDSYKDHPLEVLASDLEVVGRFSRDVPHFVGRGETPHSENINRALRHFREAPGEVESYMAQQHLVTAMGGDPEGIPQVPTHAEIKEAEWQGEWLLRKQLQEALGERLETLKRSLQPTETPRRFGLRDLVGLSPELRDRFTDLGYENVRAGEESLIELMSGRDPLEFLSVFADENVGDPVWKASGVMLEPGLAVTNAHVVLPGYDAPMPDDLMVSGRLLQYDTEFPVEQMLVEASRDLAFLQIPQDAIQGRAEFATALQPGMPLIHRGAQDAGESQSRLLGSLIEEWRGRLFTDRPIPSGLSGGEILDPQGRLLGINYGDYTGSFRGKGIGAGVSAQVIQEIMQSPDFRERFVPVEQYFAARNAVQISDDMAAVRKHVSEPVMYLMDRVEALDERYTQPELLSGRNERDIVAELLGRAGVPREPQRRSFRTYGEPVDTLTPQRVEQQIKGLRQEMFVDMLKGEDAGGFGFTADDDIAVLEDQLDFISKT